jgi:hypothetical protein
MGGKASRDKGKRGERYVASLFKEYGYDAKRSAQFCGKTGQAADVVGVPFVHLEVKFQETMRLYDWMAQAVRDSEAEGKGNLPVVIHKQNNKDLLVTLRFDDWMKLYTEWEAGQLPFNEKGEEDGI